MTVVFLGIDLAENVFALHGVDSAGRGDTLVVCPFECQVRRHRATH